MSRNLVGDEDVKTLFASVNDRLFDTIELQIRDATLPYKQFSDSASILMEQTLAESPLTLVGNPNTTVSASVATQFPSPRCYFQPKPSAGRCAAKTLAAASCRAESFLPFTLRTAHWRSSQRHRLLYPGGGRGTKTPGTLRPSEAWISSSEAYNVYIPYKGA